MIYAASLWVVVLLFMSPRKRTAKKPPAKGARASRSRSEAATGAPVNKANTRTPPPKKRAPIATRNRVSPRQTRGSRGQLGIDLSSSGVERK